jgi:hypothetical protein
VNGALLINAVLTVYSRERIHCKLLQPLYLLNGYLLFDWHPGGMAELRHGPQHFFPAPRTAQNRKTDASIGDDQAISNESATPATKPDRITYYYEAVG